MINTIYNTNGTIDIVADAEVFIIPNRAAKISSYIDSYQDKYRKFATEICANNGIEFDEETDWLVECWLVSEDLGSDNIPDHGFSFKCGEERFHVYSGEIGRYIPRSLINIKEGETTTITYKNLEACSRDRNSDSEMVVNVNITLNVTAAQEKYRYRRFGAFEDVLVSVC